MKKRVQNRETVRIRGWAIAPKPVTVRIFDADKKPVAAEIQRTDRVDVNQLFEEAQDPGKTGFFSEITNVSGKCLYVVFYAGEKKTVHVVPLRKADILAKKLDKYVEKGNPLLENLRVRRLLLRR